MHKNLAPAQELAAFPPVHCMCIKATGGTKPLARMAKQRLVVMLAVILPVHLPLRGRCTPEAPVTWQPPRHDFESEMHNSAQLGGPNNTMLSMQDKKVSWPEAVSKAHLDCHAKHARALGGPQGHSRNLQCSGV